MTWIQLVNNKQAYNAHIESFYSSMQFATISFIKWVYGFDGEFVFSVTTSVAIHMN